jgi:Cu/Ag efflux protein CusF
LRFCTAAGGEARKQVAMNRPLLSGLALVLLATIAVAQTNPQKGKFKKFDADKGVVTITTDGKDRDLLLTDETRMPDVPPKEVKDRLKTFKEGADVMFLAATKDGKDVLVGIKRVEDDLPPKVDTSGFKPLTELGAGEYQGYKGGLYPDGTNERPKHHEAAGVALAKKVQPLDADGKPSPEGKIVLLSIGMSNTTQEFRVFKKLADADRDKNSKLTIVDGAQGGMTAARIKDPESKDGGTQFWTTVDNRLKDANVSHAQVQAVWIKEADAGPNEKFPKYPEKLQAEMGEIARVLHKRFPNVKLVYLSSRIYGGYATTKLNPEPYAYESGFAVKWLIEQQIKGDKSLNYDADKGEVKAPWLSWGPYLWANGTTKREDGLSYDREDLAGDGTHPTASGADKVAKQLLQFFKSDTTTKPWFLGR